MSRRKKRIHTRITISLERELLELISQYSPLDISRTIEIALRDFLYRNFGVEYELKEESKYVINDELIKKYSQFYEKKKPDLTSIKKFLL